MTWRAHRPTGVCDQGLPAIQPRPRSAEPIRLGEDTIYRLPEGVAWISRRGQNHAGRKSGSPAGSTNTGFPAVRILHDIAQPLDITVTP